MDSLCETTLHQTTVRSTDVQSSTYFYLMCMATFIRKVQSEINKSLINKSTSKIIPARIKHNTTCKYKLQISSQILRYPSSRNCAGRSKPRMAQPRVACWPIWEKINFESCAPLPHFVKIPHGQCTIQVTYASILMVQYSVTMKWMVLSCYTTLNRSTGMVLFLEESIHVLFLILDYPFK